MNGSRCHPAFVIVSRDNLEGPMQYPEPRAVLLLPQRPLLPLPAEAEPVRRKMLPGSTRAGPVNETFLRLQAAGLGRISYRLLGTRPWKPSGAGLCEEARFRLCQGHEEQILRAFLELRRLLEAHPHEGSVTRPDQPEGAKVRVWG